MERSEMPEPAESRSPGTPENTRSPPLVALKQLVLLRLRFVLREPGGLFFTLFFPVALIAVLGLAFQNKGSPDFTVVVEEAPGSAEILSRLNATEGLHAISCPATEGEKFLRRGRALLVVVPGPQPELVVDPSQPDSRAVRILVADALERMSGRKDVLAVKERASLSGPRYVDFLVPGLLSYALMNSALWTFTLTLARMREGKLLKRLATTPMARGLFLLSFLITRVVLALLEIAVILGASRLIFGIHLEGGLLAVVGFGLGGALCFTAMSFLAGSRALTADQGIGMVNLMLLPMMLLSGVFFPSSRFPELIQPIIHVLPLTALIDGMRAIILEGSSVLSLGKECLVLLAWGLGSFAVSLKLMRWS